MWLWQGAGESHVVLREVVVKEDDHVGLVVYDVRYGHVVEAAGDVAPQADGKAGGVVLVLCTGGSSEITQHDFQLKPPENHPNCNSH